MTRTDFCDYYDFLGLEMKADAKEIYNAWKNAKELYMAGPSNSYFSADELRELLVLVDEAYSVLSHPVKRATYNELLSRRMPERYSSKKMKIPVSAELRAVIQSSDQLSGPLLHRLRQEAHCSLEQLSQITKIKGCYLEALENDEFSKLPAAVFVRGYIAQIAKVFGLDEKRACQAYMNHFNGCEPI